MKSVNIDLGKEAGDYPEPCCPAKSDGEKRYPCFYYDGEDPIELPKEGKLIIEFKRVSQTSSETDGEERYSCTIEVRKIVGLEGSVEAPTKKYDEAGDALDAIVKALSKEKE